MTIRETLRSIVADLPLPEGVKRVLRQLDSQSAPTIPAPHDVSTPTDTRRRGAELPPVASIDWFQSKSEYDLWRGNHHTTLAQRFARELTVLPVAAGPFAVAGYCVACESHQEFTVDSGANDTQPGLLHASINWRESLLCPCCGLNNRMRASIDLFTAHRAGIASGNVYMTEQVTPLYGWMNNRYLGVTGSEYLGEGNSGGTTYDGIRHEDTTHLSFASDSLDCVLSFDVLEHIPDYSLAINEMFRCLRPGGFLLLSAPFVSDNDQTIVRARLLPDGGIDHLLPAEYHGNPTAPDSGSLCYYHFGWDLLDELKKAGFTAARVVSYYSFERGNFGKPQLFFWASKMALRSA